MRHVSVQSKTRRSGPTAFVLNLSHAGLGAIRSLGRAGVPVIGLDPDPSHLGFASRYCRAKLCPHPVYDQDQLADFLVNEGKRLSRHTEGLAEVARLMAPRIAGQTISQANLIVMTNFASRLGEGRISALNYAQQLVLLPHGVLALSLSTVIFPLMARQYELKQFDALKQTLHRALSPLVFLSIPAAIGLFAFRVSIVQVVFQYGSFTSESTALVAEAVGYFALGLLARAVIEPVTRAFYAMHDTRTPLIVSMLMIVTNITLSWLLAPRLGHGGLALSISITSTIKMLALLAILARRSGGLGQGFIAASLRLLPAVAIMTFVSFGLSGALQRMIDPVAGYTVWNYGAVAVSLATAGTTYLLAAYVLRVPAFYQLLRTVQRRLGR